MKTGSTVHVIVTIQININPFMTTSRVSNTGYCHKIA